MRISAALGVALFALVFSVSCGAGSHSKGDGKANGINLNLRWPDGYHFDSATRSLVSPGGAKSAAAPVYVISATVYIAGEGVEPVAFAIPLDTGMVDGTLPPGFYTFYVEVVTDLGYVFTGQADVTLVPGPNGDITIDLEINSPPEILDILFSPTYAAPGDTVFLEAIVEDMDPDDTLTYTWIGYGVDVYGSGPTASFVLPYQTSGSIGVTLYVEDGQGGIAWYDMGEVTDNQWPWIDNVTSSNYSPFINDVVTLTCDAHDDDGDTLDYFWYDGYGWFAYGPVTQYTVPTDAALWITCEVYDGRGGYDYNWVTLNMGAAGGLPTAPTGFVAVGGDQLVNLTWNPVAGAMYYNIYWDTVPGVTTASSAVIPAVGPSSYFDHLARTNGQTYYYIVTAANATGEGPPSGEVSATPAVGASIPMGLTAAQWPGGLKLNWNAVAGAISYNIYYDAATGVTTGSPSYSVASNIPLFMAPTGTTWYIRVSAVTGMGESGLSTEISATSAGDGINGTAYYDVITQNGVNVDLCADPDCIGASDPLFSTFTAGGGFYNIESVPAGNYYLNFYPPGGWQQTHYFYWFVGPIALDGVPAPATQDLYVTKDVRPIITPTDGAPLGSGVNSMTVTWTANPDVVGGYDVQLWEIVGPTATLVEGPTNVGAGTTHTFVYALNTNYYAYKAYIKAVNGAGKPVVDDYVYVTTQP